MQNKPREAAAVFEVALQEQPNNQKLHLYLGVVYEQMELYNQAVSILQTGAEIGGPHTGDIRYNLAQNLQRLGRLEEAEATLSRLIDSNPRDPYAYLMRANVQVKPNDPELYADAIADYTLFLNLAPDAPQAPDARRMVALLRGMIEDEQARIAEEERRRREEEARRQALLDSVLNSLDTAGQETQSLSGGSEDIREVEDTIDIAD